MSLLENSGFGQICNAKAKGRSNEGEECYFIEKKVDVGRGCSEPKSSGGKSSEWGRFLPELLGWWLLVGDAAAAKSLQLCLTLYNLTDSSPPGSPSLGFSRQEHWSGLPFPSPMHESEKWKWSRSVVSDSSWPHGLQPTRLLCPWDLPGKRTGVGCHCLLR